jgi:hypothetical protein
MEGFMGGIGDQGIGQATGCGRNAPNTARAGGQAAAEQVR